MKQQYIIEITEVEKCPENWTHKTAWPGMGLYKVKTDRRTIYHVYEDGVNYILQADDMLKNPYKDPGESVSEALLLKAIAAASRAEVLK